MAGVVMIRGLRREERLEITRRAARARSSVNRWLLNVVREELGTVEAEKKALSITAVLAIEGAVGAEEIAALERAHGKRVVHAIRARVAAEEGAR